MLSFKGDGQADKSRDRMGSTSKKPAITRAVKSQSPAGFSEPAVDAVFRAYPRSIRTKLMALRRLIFDTAKTTKGVGRLEETLKWGQPSYVTVETKSGSTIRIDQVKSADNQYAVYFHCQTDLVATFRELYSGEMSSSGNRSIILNAEDEVPEPALRHCLALALTYHLKKRKTARRK
jgi:hypothetical protein